MQDLAIAIEDYDLVQVKDSIVMVRRVATLEDVLADFEIVEMEDVKLPEGVTPLSPILQLTPENHEFDTPVHLIIPMCVGATKAWRSCPDGWEELQEAVFCGAYMSVRLTHFCRVFAGVREVTPEDTVAVPFYRHQDNGIQVRWAVCHLDCNGCAESLERKRRVYLDGFRSCGGNFDMGTKTHQSRIKIRSNTGAPGVVTSEQSSDEFILDFARFPLVRPRDGTQSFLPQGCFILRLEVPQWGFRQELILKLQPIIGIPLELMEKFKETCSIGKTQGHLLENWLEDNGPHQFGGYVCLLFFGGPRARSMVVSCKYVAVGEGCIQDWGG